jgi:hypothetical protein
MEKRIIPKFESEAEEARWWYENREELAQDFVNAVREGRSGPGSVARLREKQRAREAGLLAATVAVEHSRAS